MRVIGIVLLLLYCIVWTSCFENGKTKHESNYIYYFLDDFHHNKHVFRADSLAYNDRIDEAVILFRSIGDTIQGILKNYVNCRLLSLTSLTDQNNPELLKKVKAIPDELQVLKYFRETSKFDYYYQFYPDSIDLNALESLADTKPLNKYFQAGLYFRIVSKYHIKFENFQYVISELERTLYLMKEYPFYTILHLDIFELLSQNYLYTRQHNSAEYYADQMTLFKNFSFSPDKYRKAKMHNIKGMILRRVGKNDLLTDEMRYSEELIGQDSCDKEWQVLLYNKMSLIFRSRDSVEKNEFQRYFNMMSEQVRKCKKQHTNYCLLMGLHESNNGEDKSAKEYLSAAIDFELQKIKPDESILSIVVNEIMDLYMTDKDYKNAMNTVMLDAGYKEAYNKDAFIQYCLIDIQFPFHFFINIARIRYEEYKTTKDIEKLKEAYDYVKLIDETLYEKYDVTDEDAIIRFADDVGGTFIETGLKVCFELWEVTGDDYYKNKFIALDERHSGVIFARDFQLKQGVSVLPDSLQKKELFLISEVKNFKRFKNISNRYNDAPVQYSKFQRDVRASFPDYKSASLFKEIPDIGTIKQKLAKTESCILKFNMFNDKLFVTLVNGVQTNIYSVKTEDHYVDKLTKLIDVLVNNHGITPKEFRDLSFQIYDWLFPGTNGPLLAKNIIFIPSGIFYNLNIEALVKDTVNNSKEFSELNYLINNHEVIYSTGLSHLEESDQSATGTSLNVSAFSYTGEKEENLNLIGGLSNIKGTLYELREIKNSFPKAGIYDGKKASLNQFKLVFESDKTDIVHLGLHGFSESSERDNVKLYFRRGMKRDSLLGYELLNLDTRAKLVVLSACQSAIGNVHDSEGVYSMSRYFMINGISNVISSLWDADDKTSALIFKKFYSTKDLNKLVSGKALHEIKRDLCRQRSLHPHYVFGYVRYSTNF
ncbi:MAG: CHAT domain-containing protein [Saprospiraceae bacterium]|nr:CHAT domain-containing protein [Saprospiraceae bacterium]